MRTVIVTVTDVDGVVLDTSEYEVPSDYPKIGVRSLPVGYDAGPGEIDLTIGVEE